MKIKVPKTLNYGVRILALEFRDQQFYLRVVDYSNRRREVRLPGGRFHPEHLLKVLEYFIKKNGNSKTDPLLDFHSYVSEVSLYYAKALTEIKRTNYLQLNMVFDLMTKDLFDRFQKLKIKDDQFEAILRRTHILTAREELREEIGAEEIGTLFYSSISQSEHNGVHSKIDFVTLNVKAPDQKEGCGDPKILRSYLLSLTKQIPQVLSTKHLCCLSAGITKAISLKLHPKISVLSEIILDSQ